MTAPHTVVAVGASLGGLRAVSIVLTALTPDFRAALLIAQHRRADVDSSLVQLLGQRCVLPVVEPDDKTALLGGRVYVAPAGYHLLVEGSTVALSIDEPVNFARPSIDVLFETTARAFRQAAVGILLTGSSEDGAHGLGAIRRYGGRTIVQDPDEAESPVAPRAALRLGVADETLTLAEIAALLVRIG